MFEFRDNIIEKLINKDLENLTETEIKAIEIALTMEELYERVLDERLGLSETDNFKLRYKGWKEIIWDIMELEAELITLQIGLYDIQWVMVVEVVWLSLYKLL